MKTWIGLGVLLVNGVCGVAAAHDAVESPSAAGEGADLEARPPEEESPKAVRLRVVRSPIPALPPRKSIDDAAAEYYSERQDRPLFAGGAVLVPLGGVLALAGILMGTGAMRPMISCRGCRSSSWLNGGPLIASGVVMMISIGGKRVPKAPGSPVPREHAPAGTAWRFVLSPASFRLEARF